MPKDLLNFGVVIITPPVLLFWSIYFLIFIHMTNKDICYSTVKILTE